MPPSRTRHGRLLVLGEFALLCAVVTSCSAGNSADEAQQFSRMFVGYSANYEPASSPQELAEWSTLVVEGKVVDIIDGREHGRSHADPSLALSVSMVVEVEQSLKGKSGDLVHVEMPSPGNTPASSYKEVGAGLPVVLFLIPAHHELGIIIDETAGRPEGEPLFQLTNPQGMVVGAESSVTHILEFATYPGSSLQDFYPDRTHYPDDGDDPEGS